MLLALKSTRVCFVTGSLVLIMREKLLLVEDVEVICGLRRCYGPLWFKYYHLHHHHYQHHLLFVHFSVLVWRRNWER